MDERPTTIGVCTFHRPERLARLLESLLAQSEDDRCHEIVVVDNDAGGSAKATVDAFADSRIQIRYVVEPEAGLSAARNRLVSECRTPLLAMVDDDETVDGRWISELLACQKRTGAVAVVGRVIGDFDDDTPPAELRAAGVFDYPTWSADEQIDTIMTGNVLFDLEAIEDFRPLFDSNFGLTGGEDHLLGRRLTGAGLAIHHAAAARSTEWIDATRVETDAAFFRLRRSGNSLSKVDLYLADGRRERLETRLGIVRAIAKSTLLLGAAAGTRLGLPDAVTYRMRYHGEVGWGQVLGLVGVDVLGYGRPS